MIESNEPAIDGKAGDLPGLGLDWAYVAPGFGIVRWDCSGARRELSAEKQQLWHVVSFVHQGAFVLHGPGRPILIDQTSVVFYNPEAPFRTEHPFGCDDHGSALVIHRDFLQDVLRNHDPAAEDRMEGLFRHTVGQGFSAACLRQRLIVRRLVGEGVDPLAVEAAVLHLLGTLTGALARREGIEPVRRDPERARRRYVEDAKAILQVRFRERLRLDDVARALHVSTYHLCRLFKQETGVPIHRYLNRLRLMEALEPLAQGDTDLSMLALDLGFSSHSHFTAAFRKEFAMSPSEVRRTGTVLLPGDIRHP
ncbi:MAG TPA: AraC family transcriptional regulator [Thermoanaerobaculia bacterium]|nr:AraC family transcriptional regulator [Thermoanaerobaculia bacterium]